MGYTTRATGPRGILLALISKHQQIVCHVYRPSGLLYTRLKCIMSHINHLYITLPAEVSNFNFFASVILLGMLALSSPAATCLFLFFLPFGTDLVLLCGG